jgi:hypothetical protein
MHQILGHCLCGIELILLNLGNSARAALAPYIFFVAQVLVYFKDMFNKYVTKIFFFYPTFNVYRNLSILANFLDKVQSHGV